MTLYRQATSAKLNGRLSGFCESKNSDGQRRHGGIFQGGLLVKASLRSVTDVYVSRLPSIPRRVEFVIILVYFSLVPPPVPFSLHPVMMSTETDWPKPLETNIPSSSPRALPFTKGSSAIESPSSVTITPSSSFTKSASPLLRSGRALLS